MSQQKIFSLILLYDKMSLSLPVAQALKEKNIDVHIAQNAGELIQSIAARNVDLVGLSVNHASTRSLIQVLREKTKVKILIFGEDKSPATAERVDRLDADFKVNGVATAYNVWMKIAQAVKFKMKESDHNGNVLYSGGKGSGPKQDAAIVVKSGKNEQKERTGSEIISSSKKNKKIKQQKSENKENDSFTFEQQKDSKQDVMLFKKEDKDKNKKDSSPFKKNSSLKKAKGKSDEQAVEDEVSALETMFKDPFKKKSSDILDSAKESKEAPSKGGVTMDQSDLEFNPEVDLEKMSAEESGELGNVMQTEQKKEVEPGSVIHFDRNKKKKENKKEQKSKSRGENSQAAAEEDQNKAPFKQIVESAAHSSYVAKESSVTSFGPINKLTVVPVDKNRDRGFLIFCTNDNQFVTSSGTPIDAFKKSLQEMLDHNDALGIGESYNIETEEIDVQSWVQNGSDFHVIVEDPKSQKEILICFVSKEAIYPDTNKSIELNMLKVELEVIPVLTPINFNIFLYFARNKRLVPYLRRGGKITEAQMQRLGKHGIDTIYISEADRKALYSFFISQTIYQDLRPTKKAE